MKKKMKKTINKIVAVIGLVVTAGIRMAGQPADSLTYYLETAARNNPLVNADFALYKASLEKIPQAGAYADPELEMGFFMKPMEQLSGKQVADFTLMQMFPWFGTRKAARNEATEMARMAYEQFRDSRNNLFYEVKIQWYLIGNLNEQEKNTRANLALVNQLEQLALNRFTAPAAQSQGTAPVQSPVSSPVVPATPVSGGMSAMSGMGGSGNTVGSQSPAVSPNTQSMSGMSGRSMGGGSMQGNAPGSMSDILRIQMEKAELENQLETIRSGRRSAEAKFNALLNREQSLPVMVPDTLVRLPYTVVEAALADSIAASNPMLTMLEAEAGAYKAKAVMDKKMSLPMFGIGLQYSIMAKNAGEMAGMDKMNGMDMFMPMVKVSIPVFRKKYNAQQRESRFYREASELKYADTLNRLQAEYTMLRLQLSDAARKVDLYTGQYQLSLSAYNLIVKEFSAGMAALTDVIQVERQLLDYGLKKSEAITEYNTMIAGLEKIVSTSVNE